MSKGTKIRYNTSRIALRLQPYQDAADTIGDVGKDEAMLVLTKGQFSMIDVIEHLTTLYPKADVTCITWSIGVADAELFSLMVASGQIEKLTLGLDRTYKNRQSQNIQDIEELIGRDNIKAVRAHSKITLIKSGDMHFVITASMNINKNKTCEHFTLHESEVLYCDVKSAVSELMAEEGFFASDARVTEKYARAWGDEQTSLFDFDDR